jgi:hypothetical protein
MLPRRIRSVAVLLVGAFCLARQAPAGELTISAVVGEVLRPDLTPFPEGANPGVTTLHRIPLTARVDFYVEINNLLPGESGFRSVRYDLELRNADQSAARPGWHADLPMVDTNGELPDGLAPKWTWNHDLGRPELGGMALEVTPGTFGPVGIDPRRTIGQNGPEFIGSAYVDWNGEHVAVIDPTVIGNGRPAFGIYGPDLTLVANGPIHGSTLSLGLPATARGFDVLDWDLVRWPAREDFDEVFSVSETNVSVSFSGDTAFASFSPLDTPGPRLSQDGDSLFPDERDLHLIMNWEDADDAMTTTVAFSNVVEHVGFEMRDVDRGVENGFFDEVTVVGFLGDHVVIPTVRGDITNQVVGNVVTGVASNFTSDGDVRVSFNSPIDRFELIYGNGDAVSSNPGTQSIRLHDIHFAVAVPEPAGIALAFTGMIACHLAHLVKRKRG